MVKWRDLVSQSLEGLGISEAESGLRLAVEMSL